MHHVCQSDLWKGAIMLEMTSLHSILDRVGVLSFVPICDTETMSLQEGFAWSFLMRGSAADEATARLAWNDQGGQSLI